LTDSSDGWASRPTPILTEDQWASTPRFYQTKPFVMLRKQHLCDSERMGCIHYRKMTNGFVFLEVRNL
jgi:hypothetical protein